MRVIVKKWGNGIAVRLPRDSLALGRLEEGGELELSASRVGPSRPWKPATWRGGPKDLSTNHDQVIEEILEEKMKRWRSPTQVSWLPSGKTTILTFDAGIVAAVRAKLFPGARIA